MDPIFSLGLVGLPACTGIAAYLESEGLDGPKELSLRMGRQKTSNFTQENL